jgi:hypothetical protein
MWLKLTNAKNEPVAIAIDKITHFTPRESGGTTMYFVSERVDGTPRALAVGETFDEIYGQLNDTVSAGKSRAAKTKSE